MTESELIRAQVEKIVASGVLGKTRSYARLLEYLAACTLEGRAPKELEIATQVFGKGADFDPSQDSLVRVYAHNLRHKLEGYYATEGRSETTRLSIPRGEYRLVLTAPETAEPAIHVPHRWGWRWAVIAVAALVFGWLGGVAFQQSEAPAQSAFQRVAAHPLWAGLLDDDLPVLLVFGDYYIFAELDHSANVERLVRDFAINSSSDLDELLMYEPELIGKYRDLDLTYLPRASAFAEKDVLRVLYTSDKPVRVTTMSELNVSDLRTHHIVYVGYISALDKLMEFVFASSGLEVGATYDELTQKETGKHYTSGGGGLPRLDHRHYRDYGLLSTFPGPGGNQFVIIAGTRDAGVMHTAYAVTDARQLGLLAQSLPEATPAGPLAFEVLYEVTGFNRTNLDAMPVYAAGLDYRKIWGVEPIPLSLRDSP